MRSSVLTKELMELVGQYESWTYEQRMIFLDLVDPQPEVQAKPTTKRKRTGGKSRRAAGLANQIGGKVGIQRCTAVVEGSDEPCGEPQGHALHEDKSYANYHPFVSGAQSAGERSSRKSPVVDSAVSTEVETESVLAAGGGD